MGRALVILFFLALALEVLELLAVLVFVSVAVIGGSLAIPPEAR